MESSKTTYLDFAIQNLRPSAEYTFNNADYSTINWIFIEEEPPTQKEIDDEIKKIKAKAILDEKERQTKRQEILNRLGLTEEEAKLLLA